MARKGLGKERAKKGTIPSKNYLNDRARKVAQLFKSFGHRFEEDKKSKMITKCEQILRDGERKGLFVGKDPHLTGIEIFVAVVIHFSYDHKCPITYKEIRDVVGSFSSGNHFTSMLKLLSKEYDLIYPPTRK